MILGTSNLLEIFTLVSAAIAAIASVAAAAFSGLIAGRQDHRHWLRDLRTRVYGDAISSADQFADAIADFIARAGGIDDESELREATIKCANELADSVPEVHNRLKDAATFGSRAVGEKAKAVAESLNRTVTKFVSVDTLTREAVQLNEYRSAVNEFRIAARRSLEVTDD